MDLQLVTLPKHSFGATRKWPIYSNEIILYIRKEQSSRLKVCAVRMLNAVIRKNLKWNWKTMTHCHKRTELPYKGVRKNRYQIPVPPVHSLPRIKDFSKIPLSGRGQVCGNSDELWAGEEKAGSGNFKRVGSGKRITRWQLCKRSFSEKLLKLIQSISKRALMAQMSLNVLQMFSKRGYFHAKAFALNTPAPTRQA